MANKHQIIALHRQNPNLSSVEIACRLDCSDEYVRSTFYRNGLKLPPASKSRTYALGLACIRAGLTLQELNEIAQRRSF